MGSQRTNRFHVAAAICVCSTMLSCFALQDHITAMFQPLNKFMDEHKFVPQVMLFIVLTKIAEPAPHVILLAAAIVWAQPRELWSWYSGAVVPRMAIPGYDERGIVLGFAASMWLLFACVYWINGLLYLMAEQVVCGEVIERLRIQRLKLTSRPPLGNMFRNLLFTTFVLIPPLTLLGGWGNVVRYDLELPSAWEIVCQLVVAIISNEVTFFYGHWWMHANKWMYANVHKRHHEFKAPMAIAAIYCHPLEFIISDIMPMATGLALLRPHLFTAWTWCIFAVLGTQTHHSGVSWPWIDRYTTAQPNFHDYHHEKFSVNYGNLGWLDDLHGTSWDWKREDTRFYRTRKGGRPKCDE